MRNHYSNVFSFLLYAGYGITIKGMRIIILFALCRYAHYCAFISVIELPRIPAYCPKNFRTHSRNRSPYFSNLYAPTPDTSSISASVTGFKIHICVSVLSENTIYGGTFSSDAISRRSARSASKSVSSFSVNSAAPAGSFAPRRLFLLLPATCFPAPSPSSSRLAPVLPGKQHLFPSI